MRRARSLAACAGALFASLGSAGCHDVQTIDPGRQMVPLVPNASGRVEAGSNPLGITGHWYSYGDPYADARRCTEIGKHPAEECSSVAWPAALPTLDFPTSGNEVCTYGKAAVVTACTLDAPSWCLDSSGKPSNPDYSNMWGAGIGLDFGLDVDTGDIRQPENRVTWSADEHGIAGVSFDFRWIDTSAEPDPFVRVEFPIALKDPLKLPADTVLLDGSVEKMGETLPSGSSSEEHPSGSPFMDAPPLWGSHGTPSDVVVGHNERLFSDVDGPPFADAPGPAYPFDTTRLLGIQFHVPTVTAHAVPYGFCVSNLAMLRR